MPDRRMFLQALSDFAHALIAPYDVEVVLGELTGHVTAVLGLAGSGVSLVQDGQLHFANAVNPAAIDLEQAQHDHRTGPCLDAIRTGEVVAIADLTDLGERWPEYVAVARRHGVSSVAGIPLTLVDATVGALDLYSHEPASGRPRSSSPPASSPTWPRRTS